MEDGVICKHCTSLYQGLEHLRILVFVGVLEPIPDLILRNEGPTIHTAWNLINYKARKRCDWVTSHAKLWHFLWQGSEFFSGLLFPLVKRFSKPRYLLIISNLGMLLKEIQTTMSGFISSLRSAAWYMGTGFKVYQVQVLLDFDAEHNQEYS